jgi:hypothetical protein
MYKTLISSEFGFAFAKIFGFEGHSIGSEPVFVTYPPPRQRPDPLGDQHPVAQVRVLPQSPWRAAHNPVSTSLQHVTMHANSLLAVMEV